MRFNMQTRGDRERRSLTLNVLGCAGDDGPAQHLPERGQPRLSTRSHKRSAVLTNILCWIAVDKERDSLLVTST